VAKEIRLPKMGQTMEEGTIVKWLVEVGSEIKRGDVLCEVETDKATMEMDSPADGVVKAILVPADSVVAVNAPVAVVGARDEVVSKEFLASLGAGTVAPAQPSSAPVAAPAASAPAASGPLPAGIKEVKLEKMGQTMEEGTIVKVLVKVGDQVKRGDVIFEIETDKATMEMESAVEGFVKRIDVKEGDVQPCGATLMLVGGKDDSVPAATTKVGTTIGRPTHAVASAAAPAAVELPAGVKPVMLEKMGQTMEEGTIVKALVKVGGQVKRGDVLFEIETDKATMEMESTVEGFVKFIAAKEGDVLPVGSLLMVVAGEKDEIPAGYIDSLMGSAPAAIAEAGAHAVSPAHSPAGKPAMKAGGKVFASPKARMLARKKGVDLAAIKGSGPGGRIVAADVERTGAGIKAVPAAAPVGQLKLGSRVPLTKLQKITGQRMVQSKREIPCFYLQVRADVTDLVELREQLKKQGQTIAYNDFIIKALALSLEKFPIMTGQFTDDFIVLADSINIGLAISVPDGLVAPIVKNCQKKDVGAIAADSKMLIDKARNNKLTLEDFEGGCTTVSSLGAFGIESFIPIVVPGQCSILGVGQISDALVPVRSDILRRKLMAMVLSVDHRITNGAYAAQFLDHFRKLLEDTNTFK